MIIVLLVPVHQLLFRRASSILLVNIQRTIGNALADSWQALGLYDDLLGEFQLASSSELPTIFQRTSDDLPAMF